MKAFAQVQMGLNSPLRVDLKPLEVAEIVACRYGFFDLDIDNGPHGIKIVATAKNRSLTVNGKNTEQAVERLLEVLNG